MEAISLGIDLIATDLPFLLTTVGHAFSRYNMTPSPLQSKCIDSSDGTPPAKKRKMDSLGDSDGSADSFYINIRDRKFARDLRPLVRIVSLIFDMIVL